MTNTTARALAEAIRVAADRLDSEEHRYVERFHDCPNGCEFVDLVCTCAGLTNHAESCPRARSHEPVRVAGPEGCDCFLGSAEDEDANHFTPVIDRLRGAAATMSAIAQLVDVIPTTPPEDLHDVLQSYKEPLTALLAVLRTPMPPLS